jgi:uncharacterized protein (DUF697 family)/GNAT superfamily N-acetyltransferase
MAAPGSTRLATNETDRLTNMMAAMGAGVALVPIPGTAAALTGMEILQIGVIAKIWGVPLTPGYLTGLMGWMMARFGVTMGMLVLGDLIGMVPGLGTVAKSAIAAGTIKFIGSSMNHRFREQFGASRMAMVTAESAKQALDDAAGRLPEHAADLAEGAKQAFSGNGSLLARTLNEIFGLNLDEGPEPSEVSPNTPSYQLKQALPVDFPFVWQLTSDAMRPIDQMVTWNDDEQRLKVQQAVTSGIASLVVLEGNPIGWLDADLRCDPAQLRHLVLLPKWRRKGIGTDLIAQLTLAAEAAGRPLDVRIWETNEGAHSLFRRIGFQTVEHTGSQYVLRWEP